MSARSRSAPWFGTKGERHEDDRRRNGSTEPYFRVRIANKDPITITLPIPVRARWVGVLRGVA